MTTEEHIAKLQANLTKNDFEFLESFLGIPRSNVERAFSPKADPRIGQALVRQIELEIENHPDLKYDQKDDQTLRDLKQQVRDKATAIVRALSMDLTDSEKLSEAARKFLDQARAWTGKVDEKFYGVLERGESRQAHRIGQVLLGPENLDPVDIRVSEVSVLERLSSIRSNTDPGIKMPMTVTQISIDLVFSGHLAINQDLRYLLANLLASPITTIESPFLTAALVNHYSTPEIEGVVRRQILGQDPALQDELKKLSDATNNVENLMAMLKSDDFLAEMYELSITQGKDLKSTLPTLTEEQFARLGVSIPVAFQDIVISTDPTHPNTIYARLTFLRFNSSAFGETGLEFRDINGNRTSDIMQCEPLRRYANWAFLNADRPEFYLNPYTAHTNGDKPDLECTWRDLYKIEESRDLGTTDFVIESAQIAFGVKLVPLHLIGSKYPIIQVMGRSSAEARLVIHTTSLDTVRKFAKMKDMLDAISRNVSGSFRDEQINIRNSVLNLVGARKFLIKSFEVSPMPEMSNGATIEIGLVQAEYNYRQQESLQLLDETLPKEAYKKLWDRLWELYEGFRKKTSVPTPGKELVTDQELVAARLIFGQPKVDPPAGLLQPSVVVAALMYLANKENYNLPKARNAAFYDIFERPPNSTTVGGWDSLLNTAERNKEAARRIWDITIPIDKVPLRDPEFLGFSIFERFRGIQRPEIADTYDPQTGAPVEFGTAWKDVMSVFTEEPSKYGVGLNKKLWDAMLEVILDPRPAVGKMLMSPAAEGPPYSESELESGYSTLHWLFMSDTAGRLGVDISEYQVANPLKPVDPELQADPYTVKRLTSNYPDVPLPTYADIFRDETITDPTNPNNVTVPRATRFMPTYSDIGITPIVKIAKSFTEELRRVARKETDLMEPGFWFYHQRLREQIMSRAENALLYGTTKFSDIVKNTLKVNVNLDALRKNKKVTDEESRQVIGRIIEDLSRKDAEDQDTKRMIERGTENKVQFDLIDNTGQKIGTYAPKDKRAQNAEYEVKLSIAGKKSLTNVSAAGLLAFDRRAENHNIAVMARMLRHIPDNMLALTKAYPAFRVYFVEWDDNYNRESVHRLPLVGRKVRMLDDLYTANSILNITVTDSKDDGAVAEVAILNTLGTFDKDVFLTDPETKAAGIGSDDEDREDFMGRMRLQTGTGIVIQAGYSSHINGLKTIFTGQIAEISPGKVIRIIAQSYKSELDQEVEINVSSGNPREAIAKLVRVGSDNKNMTPHLGRIYDSRDLTKQQLANAIGQTMADRTGMWGLQGPAGILGRAFGYTVNDVGRNVWFESDAGPDGIGEQLAQDIKESFAGDEKEFHFYGQTAWQGLEEMTRHIAGTVCAVRPYDHEATVFFGYPDQVYRYRTPMATEVANWELYVRPEKIVSKLNLESTLLAKFWASKFGTTQSDLHKRDVENAKQTGGIGGIELTDGWIDRPVQTKLWALGIDKISTSYTGFIDWATSDKRYHFHSFDDDDYLKGHDINNFPIRLVPIYETLALDFSGEWNDIKNGSEGRSFTLARFLFTYFFGIKDTAYQGGSFESQWLTLLDIAMGPWRDPTSKTLNGNWKSLKEALISKERNSPFSNLDFDLATIDIEKMKKEYEAVLNRQVARGTLSVEDKLRELARFQERLADAEKTKSLLAGVDQRFFNGRPNPLFNISGFFAPNDLQRVNANSIINVDGKTIVKKTDEFILASLPYFRLFVHYFANWMKEDVTNRDSSVVKSVKKELKYLDDSDIQPWFKPFRDFHPINDTTDIINNSIVASTSEMSNTILVRGPKEDQDLGSDLQPLVSEGNEGRVFSSALDWVSYPLPEGIPFHPRLKKSSRKLAVAVEPNCNSTERSAQTLMSNMCLAIRPMYRGELKVTGRVMFPWDIVVLHDSYTGMYGHLEVERVTHEFNAETGWVTTIVPHAYCHPNNPWGGWQIAASSFSLAWLGKALDALFWLSIIWPVGRGILSAVKIARSAATQTLQRFAQKHLIFEGGKTGVQAFAEAGLGGTIGFRGRGNLEKAAQVLAQGTLKVDLAGAAAGKVGEKLSLEVLTAVSSQAAKEGRVIALRQSGQWLARNWWGQAIRAGNILGTYSVLNAGINLTIDYHYNLEVSHQISNTALPITMKPLSYKGAPLTAGLDLGDDNFLTYGERQAGFFRELREGIGLIMKSAEKLAKGPSSVPPDPLVPEGD